MTRVEIETPGGTAWADIDLPDGAAADGAATGDNPDGDPVGVLFAGHGAGGSVDSPDLCAARDGALDAGFLVARITQPYRVAGRRAPPPAPRLDEAWLAATTSLREQLGAHVGAEFGMQFGAEFRARLGAQVDAVPTVHCGRSSGARVACRTAEASGAIAVIALAFPLHPPGKPERSRLDELDALTVPVLVVQGDRDAFGMPPAAPRRELVVIPGDTHTLKKDPSAIRDAVRRFLTQL